MTDQSEKSIEQLLDNMVLQRDMFLKESDISFWKAAYLGMYGLSNLLNTKIQQRVGHGTKIGSSLKRLLKIGNL